jgi:hypothetical protein
VILDNGDPLHVRSPKKSGGGMEGLCAWMQSVGKTRLSLGSVGLWATFSPLRLYVIFDFKTRHLFLVIFLLLGNVCISVGLIRRNFLSFLLVLPNVYIETPSRITLRFGLCRSSYSIHLC